MRIMISCGEPSGDLYAGALVSEILSREPSADVFGFGGRQLAAAGTRLVGDFQGLSVTGLTEAALASACLLGQRFAIVAISQRIRAWYRETVQANGLESRLASIRGLDEALADIGAVQEDQGERLVALDP